MVYVSFSKKNGSQRKGGIDPESDPILKKFCITQKMMGDFQKELEIGMSGVVQALVAA